MEKEILDALLERLKNVNGRGTLLVQVQSGGYWVVYFLPDPSRLETRKYLFEFKNLDELNAWSNDAFVL